MIAKEYGGRGEPCCVRQRLCQCNPLPAPRRRTREKQVNLKATSTVHNAMNANFNNTEWRLERTERRDDRGRGDT